MSESFYDVLGVTPDASTEEITDAYRERIKETHPDVSDAPDALEEAKRVIEAKETLADEEKRARYDRLGHDIYVRDTAVDADWTGTTDRSTGRGGRAGGTREDPSTGSKRGDPSSDSTRDEPGTGAGAESVYEGTWATNGVDDAGSEESTTSGTGSEETADGTSAAGADSTGTKSDGRASAGSTDDTGSRQAADESGQRRRRSRGANRSRNAGDAVGWAASVDGRHAVRNPSRERGITWEGLYPDSESYVLLVSTFICYPSLVFSSVFPGFPLVVNLIVGLCTLTLIAYLMSMPEVGVYVFGGWSLLSTLLIIGYGIPVFSLLGVLVWGTTFIPLGFTFLTYLILRW